MSGTGDDATRIQLAALLGDDVSLALLGDAAPQVPQDADALFRALREHSAEAAARGALVLLRFGLPLYWEEQGPLQFQSGVWEHGRRGDYDLPRRAVQALTQWVLCPCREHQEALEPLAGKLRKAARPLSSRKRSEATARARAWVEQLLLPVCSELAAHGELGERLNQALQARAREDRFRSTQDWMRLTWNQVRQGLLPWVLGQGDPLPAELQEDEEALAEIARRRQERRKQAASQREAKRARQRAQDAELQAKLVDAPWPADDEVGLELKRSRLYFTAPELRRPVCKLTSASQDERAFWDTEHRWGEAELFRLPEAFVIRVWDCEATFAHGESRQASTLQSRDKGWSWEPVELDPALLEGRQALAQVKT